MALNTLSAAWIWVFLCLGFFGLHSEQFVNRSMNIDLMVPPVRGLALDEAEGSVRRKAELRFPSGQAGDTGRLLC